MRSRRALTEADRLAWDSYIQHVAKLPGGMSPVAPSPVPPSPVPPSFVVPSSVVPPSNPAPPAEKLPVASPAPTRPKLAKADPLEVGTAPGGIDRATWTRFRAGKLPVARTLDLHGHTLPRAHAELHAFLARAIADRLRCVEVITGRGSGETGGAIKREFPLWLNGPALRPTVLAASHPHAANPGSVRLLLRRVR